MPRRVLAFVLLLALAPVALAADRGNRLAYLDGPCDPYYVGLDAAKFTTPQWVGEEGVELVVVLSIDDLRKSDVFEKFLRPIFERLKKVEGRAPVSIMTCAFDPNDPQLFAWFKEGVNLGAHTKDHPCPCLQANNFEKAKATYDLCVDELKTMLPAAGTVSFRLPCCDSMNSASPRLFAEIIGKTTPRGNFLEVDSSIFALFTADDPAMPRELVVDPDLRQRLGKYVPVNKKWVNYVENYPYPFVVGRLCWEVPVTVPGDWQGFNLQKACNPATVADMQAAIDATAIKQGVFTLCFHPHNWIRNDQVIQLIDHAAEKHGRRVKFLHFGDVLQRITKNALGGVPIRAANGQDNGVRVLDLNGDGYMDVVIGNDKIRQTRLWSPEKKQWIVGDFPVELVTVDAEGNRLDAGVRFGVLQKNGMASILVRNEKTAGLWHFDGHRWVADPQGLAGLEAGGPVATSAGGRDRGVRLVDLDHDGICELIVGNDTQKAVFAWSPENHAWRKLPFGLPPGTAIVDAQGRDAGGRLVDIDEDGHPDFIFSNPDRYSLYLFRSMTEGWSRKIFAGQRGDPGEILPFVRADGSNNGAWFKHRHVWVQNEETGGKELPSQAAGYFYTELLRNDFEPPPRPPEDSLRSMIPRPGFKVELMAAEPLVMDPIDIAWGPDGKAWVVEMTDYPLGLDDKGQIGGRIRVLEDTDGDGRYDRSTVFLEPIGYPTGVMPWRKGVIVATAPEVFYAEDTDGDGKADLRRTLFSGFREGNQQHRVNHPRWGLDNWVYLANGDSGGEIKSARTGEIIDISGRDLRVKPDEGFLDPQSGQTQYGRNRDDWGNWFGCTNNTQGWYYALEDHYLRRNPHVETPPVHTDLGPSRHCWPPGRVITHCFIPQPTPPEGQPMTWTCACGIMVYRDELLGQGFEHNTFIADAVYNSVHREILKREGTLLRGERAPDEQQSEFLSSADPWFRPTTIHTGPDGALWVVDMYRFVIEHPEWIDAKLVKMLNLRAGHDKGRIYRVYPVDKKPRAIPRLDKLDTTGLVAALDSPNGWQRDMAHQMLVWRADRSAVERLEEMAQKCPRPQARLHALCALDGMKALRPEIVRAALDDKHSGVVRHAIRLSEQFAASAPSLLEGLLRVASRAEPDVKMQLAYTLGEWRDARAGRLLGQLALENAGDSYILAAAMSSAPPHVEAMIAQIRSGTSEPGVRDALVKKLEKLAADIKARPELTSREAAQGTSHVLRPIEPNRQRIDKVMGRAATAEEVARKLAKCRPVLDMFGEPERGKKMFVEATCSTCHLFQGIGNRIGPDLETLNDRSPQTLMTAVIDPNRAVLDRFVECIAVTRDGLSQTGLLEEETSTSVTLVDREAKRHAILRKDLDELIYTGRSHMPEGLEAKMDLQQMADLFAFVGGKGPPPKRFPGNKPEVVRLDTDLTLQLKPSNAEIYGADITLDAQRGVLTNWTCPVAQAAWNVRVEREADFDIRLDWSCENARAGNRFALVIGGQLIPGKIEGTGPAGGFRQAAIGSVHLGPGQTRIVLRPDPPLNGMLFDFRGLALVRRESPGSEPPPRPKPEKVEAGPDGVLLLRASQAEIGGPSIILEAKYGNLGMWLNQRDAAAWTMHVPRSGVYEIWLDWACQEGTHGNTLEIKVKDQSLSIKVPSTGTWDDYKQQSFGKLKLPAGDQRLTVRPIPPLNNALLDLRAIKLVPEKR